MISISLYKHYQDEASSYLRYLKDVLEAKSSQYRYSGELKNYIANTKLNAEETKLEFNVANYSFFVESAVALYQGDSIITLKTYEVITDTFRTIPTGNKQIKHIEELKILYNDRDWIINNRTDESDTAKEYILLLKKHLESIKI